MFLDSVLHHFAWTFTRAASNIDSNLHLYVLSPALCMFVCINHPLWLMVVCVNLFKPQGLSVTHTHTHTDTRVCAHARAHSHRLAPCFAFRAITVKQLLARQEKWCWWDGGKEGARLRVERKCGGGGWSGGWMNGRGGGRGYSKWRQIDVGVREDSGEEQLFIWQSIIRWTQWPRSPRPSPSYSMNAGFKHRLSTWRWTTGIFNEA